MSLLTIILASLVIGASGFGREVAWLINEIGEHKVAGFIDNNKSLIGTVINDISVVGDIESISKAQEKINVVIAIGNPKVRFDIYNSLKDNKNICFPNIISKDCLIGNDFEIGMGNIICSGNIITTNISIKDFNHINLSSTVGHDVKMSSFNTIYPGVNISGNVTVSQFCEFGTGSKVIQGVSISDSVVIGAGGVVVRDLIESGTYVGAPAKKINK